MHELKEPPSEIGGLNFFTKNFRLERAGKTICDVAQRKTLSAEYCNDVFFLLACAIEAALSNSDKIIASKILQERDHEIRQRYML
jgi:hypothetical protein